MHQTYMFFEEAATLVNAELDRLVPESGQASAGLEKAMRWSLFGGGKRLRPALTIAAGRAFGADDRRLLGTAAAIEMIHTYSLIHDDLPSMDDDDLRRGRATCHVKFNEATAILAGDALQALAFQTIAEDGTLEPGERIKLISGLGQAASRMVVGQHLDLEAEGKDLTLAEIENIHRNKTGALIAFSAEAGAVIGKASDEGVAAVRDIGKKIGLLFQIVDDVLDITQTTDLLGKTAGKDAASQKATYPAAIGLDAARDLSVEIEAELMKDLGGISGDTEMLAGIISFIAHRNN
ncbi:MAG: polyprenyl synthetase family protein [Acidobacteria bacterium]|nr:polyprenyl synthetase family protein [Acidobacteriota bacterium]